MRSWLVGLVLVCVVACKRESSAVIAIDSVVLSTRIMQALDRPAVNKALDGLFEHAVSGPALGQRSTALLARLSADPKITAAVSSMMERFVGDPGVQQSIQKLVADHPGASEAEFGDLLAAQFEHTWESPAVNAIWMDEWNKFTQEPQLHVAVRDLLTPLGDAIEHDTDRIKRWDERVHKIGGGDITSARATQIYIDRAWASDRIEKLAVQVLSSPTVRDATRKAFADLLAVDAVAKELQNSSAQLLATPALVDNAVRLLQLLYAVEPDLDQVRAELHKMFQQPALLAAVSRIVALLATDPQVAAVGRAWLADIKQDRVLIGQIDDFFDNW